MILGYDRPLLVLAFAGLRAAGMTPGPGALPWVALAGYLVPGAGSRPGRGAPYPA
jgi:hypothetical protein